MAKVKTFGTASFNERSLILIGQGVPNDVNKTIGCVYILYCQTDTIWVLVNMKKQCLGPNMTEKLLNRLLNLNAYYETKQNKTKILVWFPISDLY